MAMEEGAWTQLKKPVEIGQISATSLFIAHTVNEACLIASVAENVLGKEKTVL